MAQSSINRDPDKVKSKGKRKETHAIENKKKRRSSVLSLPTSAEDDDVIIQDDNDDNDYQTGHHKRSNETTTYGGKISVQHQISNKKQKLYHEPMSPLIKMKQRRWRNRVFEGLQTSIAVPRVILAELPSHSSSLNSQPVAPYSASTSFGDTTTISPALSPLQRLPVPLKVHILKYLSSHYLTTSQIALSLTCRSFLLAAHKVSLKASPSPSSPISSAGLVHTRRELMRKLEEWRLETVVETEMAAWERETRLRANVNHIRHQRVTTQILGGQVFESVTDDVASIEARAVIDEKWKVVHGLSQLNVNNDHGFPSAAIDSKWRKMHGFYEQSVNDDGGSVGSSSREFDDNEQQQEQQQDVRRWAEPCETIGDLFIIDTATTSKSPEISFVSDSSSTLSSAKSVISIPSAFAENVASANGSQPGRPPPVLAGSHSLYAVDAMATSPPLSPAPVLAPALIQSSECPSIIPRSFHLCSKCLTFHPRDRIWIFMHPLTYEKVPLAKLQKVDWMYAVQSWTVSFDEADYRQKAVVEQMMDRLHGTEMDASISHYADVHTRMNAAAKASLKIKKKDKGKAKPKYKTDRELLIDTIVHEIIKRIPTSSLVCPLCKVEEALWEWKDEFPDEDTSAGHTFAVVQDPVTFVQDPITFVAKAVGNAPVNDGIDVDAGSAGDGDMTELDSDLVFDGHEVDSAAAGADGERGDYDRTALGGRAAGRRETLHNDLETWGRDMYPESRAVPEIRDSQSEASLDLGIDIDIDIDPDTDTDTDFETSSSDRGTENDEDSDDDDEDQADDVEAVAVSAAAANEESDSDMSTGPDGLDMHTLSYKVRWGKTIYNKKTINSSKEEEASYDASSEDNACTSASASTSAVTPSPVVDQTHGVNPRAFPSFVRSRSQTTTTAAINADVGIVQTRQDFVPAKKSTEQESVTKQEAISEWVANTCGDGEEEQQADDTRLPTENNNGGLPSDGVDMGLGWIQPWSEGFVRNVMVRRDWPE